MNTFVIIPMYNYWQYTHRCLMDVYTHTPQDTQVVLIDDASTENMDGVKWWKDGPLVDRLTYFRNEKNLGFGGSLNKGADIAIENGAEVICLLSNDVLVYGDFVTDVVTKIQKDKNILIGGEVLWRYTGWNTLPQGTIIPYANGWFLACHVDVWKDIGGFDPIFKKFDFEDLDVSTTAQWKGYILITCGTKLHHLSGQTVNKEYPDRVEYSKRNQKVWIEKWQDKEQELKKKIYG